MLSAAVSNQKLPVLSPSLLFMQEERLRGLQSLEAGGSIAEELLRRSDLSPTQRRTLEHDRDYIRALLPVFQSGDTWGPAYRKTQSDYAQALLVGVSTNNPGLILQG